VRATFGQLRALEASAAARGTQGVLPDLRMTVPPAEAVERIRLAAAADLPSGDVWLSLPFLPAGRYRLWADLSTAAPLELSLLGGRSDAPFISWPIAGGSAGAQSREIMLPVGLSGLRIRGNAAARSALRGIWLQPAPGGWPASPVVDGRAASARRYGRVIVYAVEGAYLEPDGLWTTGAQAAELVVQAEPGEPAAAFAMRAGPVATPVRVRSGTFTLSADLEPGEERTLTIPLSADGTAPVVMTAGRGFRPSEADASSADRRLLGVRLEPLQNLTTPPK